MSLQEIVGLLVAFCTLLGFIGKLITTLSALNYTIRSTNEALVAVQQDFEKRYAHNSESHKKLWEHNNEQDSAIKDHEIRLTLIEEKNDMIVERRIRDGET